MLGRDGTVDPGYNLWVSVLNNGAASRSDVVIGFMESPENITNAAPLIGKAPTYEHWSN